MEFPTPENVRWLSSVLEQTTGKTCDVQTVSTVEGSLVSGPHSDTAKIQLTFKDESQSLPRTLYWKKVIVKDLPHKASYKLYRDIYSYKTETSFYQYFAQKLTERNLRVAKSYFVEENFVSHNLEQSHFLLLLEDLFAQGFTQPHVLYERKHVFSCLRFLARLHSTFWNKTEQVQQLLWPEGSYWNLEKRPKDELTNLHITWPQLCERFSNEFKNKNFRSLGSLLQKWSPWVTEQMAQIKDRTLIHGDFKSANIFFRQDDNAAIQVATIDYQWSGAGAAIKDVMYLITSTHNIGLGVDNCKLEKEFLGVYCALLKEYGVQYDVEDALYHFKLASLDHARIIMAYFLNGATPESLEKASSDPGEVGYCISVPHLVSLLEYYIMLFDEIENKFSQ
ncbi:hypothetical protein AKO1_011411 [Acrasis kona]|uniref:CHK kinase-like domain-containing protein n=1 Tax=Acrasis kona TaxID=1008807 RepID=A0AAW2ZLN7_9EUKA